MIVVREVPFLKIVRCVFIHIKLRALEPKQSPRRESFAREPKTMRINRIEDQKEHGEVAFVTSSCAIKSEYVTQGSERMKSIVLYIHDGDYGVTSERDVDDEEFRIRVEGTLSKAVFFFFSLFYEKIKEKLFFNISSFIFSCLSTHPRQ